MKRTLNAIVSLVRFESGYQGERVYALGFTEMAGTEDYRLCTMRK